MNLLWKDSLEGVCLQVFRNLYHRVTFGIFPNLNWPLKPFQDLLRHWNRQLKQITIAWEVVWIGSRVYKTKTRLIKGSPQPSALASVIEIWPKYTIFWFWIVLWLLFFASWVYQKIWFFLEMALLWQMLLDVTKPAVCQTLDIKMVFLWHLLLQIQVFLTGVTSSVTVTDKIKWAPYAYPGA